MVPISAGSSSPSRHPVLALQGYSPGRSPWRKALSLLASEPPLTATMRRVHRSQARPAALPSSRLRWSAPSQPTLEGGPKRCAGVGDAGVRGWLVGCSHLWRRRRLRGAYRTFSIHDILQSCGLMMLSVEVVSWRVMNIVETELTLSPALSSLTSTATRKPSKRWRVPPPPAHPPAVVRFPPPPQPSLSRHKPLTPTPVSAAAPGGGRARWVALGKPEIRQGSNSSRLQTPPPCQSLLLSILLSLPHPTTPCCHQHPTAIRILCLAPSCWLFPTLYSLGHLLIGIPSELRRETGSKRQDPCTPSQCCTSPSFLSAWQEGQ